MRQSRVCQPHCTSDLYVKSILRSSREARRVKHDRSSMGSGICRDLDMTAQIQIIITSLDTDIAETPREKGHMPKLNQQTKTHPYSITTPIFCFIKS